MENNQVRTLTISELCNGDNYIIPIYQRNYAWGRDEIELLIQDISEALKNKEDKENNYYIGSLVVAKRKDGYEVIDGQQRLTTLKLLLSYFNKNPNINLNFEYRDESNQSLNNLGDNKYGNSIEIGYKFILDIFSKKIVKENKENDFIEEFSGFLLDKVVILRTEVPEDTDLNHYFEIMNNRGEQLEKHEVLKARLMEKLTGDDDKKLFALIWDACSDMSVYAIKRFPYSNDENKNIRTSDAFFGELVNKIPENFDKMKDILNKIEYTDKETNKESILNLLEQTDNKINQDKGSDEDGNFQSIIDFPNFLMIVYKIFRGGDVPLNDKYLLNKFEEIGDEPATIKEFIILLLKVRLIFDRYIIKSKEEEDSWILNGIKKYKDGSFREVNTFGTALEQLNKDSDKDGDTDDLSKNHIQIVQLLSMFHTSFRQNKSWLFDILEKLSKSSELENTYSLSAVEYIEILEQLAYDYYKNSKRQELFKSGGQNIPNYIFNYLDYLLWKDWDNRGKDNKFLKKSDFVFSLSRNSIEHYLAQSKRDSLLPRNETEENKNRLLNSLGNLCLISHYQNSSLNDEVPSEKRKRYESGSLKCISPKQALMLSYEIWGKEEIEKHNEDMIEILDSETKKYINNIS
ncbi:DUF262 domain-containing HNH endonuclease family protein [Gallibacterium anatis]|uniref:DUF262 domain-containing HNH endonuclease family protein n=1 Tax=Gallibacterium anatis TaxID=750 RepID=A0AAX3XEA5_9PAST|nr:DUF262 domain-containing HNH endonuclease family protein [Gallibacterium anatis]MDK9429861.1 DUF262 domain-containing HNH endonuclease family protein [Gallibacterium anatis]WIM80357.1 DUF262 domain-containing HNH endonuclease family protein [Gallibacterium anatis]